jgi:PAS domain S-box-containing protein
MPVDLSASHDDSSLFHLLVDSVQDYAIFALSAAGVVMSWNAGAQRIKGYGAAEVVGRHFSIFYTQEDREGGRPESLLRSAAADDRVEDEGWRVRKDGTRFWANVVLSALRSPNGELIGFAKVTRDLSDLRRAQEQKIQLAREQSAREAAESSAAGLRFLVEASETLASSLDYEATLRGLARLAVPAVADWCAVDLCRGEALERIAVAHEDDAKVELAMRFAADYPADRNAPHGPWRVVDTGVPEYHPRITDAMLEAGIRDPEQLRRIRELGVRSMVTVPLVGRSQALGTLTLVQGESGREITEHDVWLARELGRHAALAIENSRLHRELEEQNRQLADQSVELERQADDLQVQALEREDLMSALESTNSELRRRTAEAEEANRAKSLFLATMSHELRTPLNAIFGYADLVQMGLHGPVTPEQEEALERIKRNQRALLVLVNDVLNFARLEAGRLEIRVSTVPVGEVIADLEKLISPQIDARGLSYRCTPCPSSITVRGDRERIEQILLNLLTNAVKFTDPGGEVEVGVQEESDAVRIIVRDSGRGIPEDRLDVIFDPFVQVDRTPGDAADAGVGLGLAISRELALAMGGALSVTSVVGEGSSFTLELPRGGP